MQYGFWCPPSELFCLLTPNIFAFVDIFKYTHRPKYRIVFQNVNHKSSNVLKTIQVV